MSKRVHNFCAGPCTLPLEVLEEAQAELVDYAGSGMSVLEMSHRAAEYEAVHRRAMALSREVYRAPEDFAVLFIQGGATLQFAMLAMNLLHEGGKGGYVDSGAWAQAAIRDAAPHGEVYSAWDGGAHGHARMPATSEIELRPGTRFLHVTSNETIGGIRMTEWPEVDVPLVADMSSDYMSRAIPWEKFDLIYGGAQKNLGPAGMALVFIRESVLESTNRNLAHYLRYDVHHDKDSLFNTPPVFVIYLYEKVLRWMQAKGGLDAIEREAAHKASLLYEVIDEGNYYSSPVETESRSHMNIVFKLPSEELEKKFLAGAEAAELLNLKGHRSVGGCRASIYNALPESSVGALADFMREFQRDNG